VLAKASRSLKEGTISMSNSRSTENGAVHRGKQSIGADLERQTGPWRFSEAVALIILPATVDAWAVDLGNVGQ
jgi:hypothetical protein